MRKMIEKLDEFILPLLELVDVGNRNDRATKRWHHGKREFVKELLKSQWIDGPPKDTGKGKFLLVMHHTLDGKFHERVWDATQDRLELITDLYGEVYKHMRLPDDE